MPSSRGPSPWRRSSVASRSCGRSPVPMCSPISDGAASAVVSTLANAAAPDRAVVIRGIALGHGGTWDGRDPQDHVSRRTALKAYRGGGPLACRRRTSPRSTTPRPWARSSRSSTWGWSPTATAALPRSRRDRHRRPDPRQPVRRPRVTRTSHRRDRHGPDPRARHAAARRRRGTPGRRRTHRPRREQRWTRRCRGGCGGRDTAPGAARMNLAELLGASAQRVPSALALVSGTRPITTYRELAQRVAGRAHTLSRQHGIGPGHQVAIYATNSPEYLEYLFAIWWAGATAIPLSAMLHPREVAALLADSRASLCLVSADKADEVAAETARARCWSGPRSRWRTSRSGRARWPPMTPLDLLHERHHRPPQRSGAHARQLDGHDARVPLRRRAGRRALRSPPSRPDEPRRWTLLPSVHRPWGPSGGA